MPKRKRGGQAAAKKAVHPLLDTFAESDPEDAGSGDEEVRPGLRKRVAPAADSDAEDEDNSPFEDANSEEDGRLVGEEGAGEEVEEPDSEEGEPDGNGAVSDRSSGSEGASDSGSDEDGGGSESSDPEPDDDEIPVIPSGPTVADILAMVKAGRAAQDADQKRGASPDEDASEDGASSRAGTPDPDPAAGGGKKKKGPLDAAALARFQKTHDRTGVVYLSRIPPFMKPQKLRHLLQRHGAIGRLYVQPEPAHVARRRAASGGNRKANFTEGWVEFLDKKDAKQCAEVLNNAPVGGKKRNFHHDDIWNIKYLPGFKWSHLAERIAYERAAREQKVRIETQQARRENRAYLRSVADARMIEAIESRKRRKEAAGLVSGAAGATATAADGEAPKRKPEADDGGKDDGPSSLEKLAAQFKRRFKQRKVIDDAVGGGIGGVKKGTELPPEQLAKQKRVLSKIFG
ncbi:hypothetical protein DFJ74DRAFT_657654 [Hyaloraphidium curvatum]|nr:hypothetical protein DFJ74DRAFT_657654 [Hyaloraphidium curvatum]